LFAELDGLEWLQRQIQRYSWERQETSDLLYLTAIVVYAAWC
jgi:hypothetical protein